MDPRLVALMQMQQQMPQEMPPTAPQRPSGPGPEPEPIRGQGPAPIGPDEPLRSASGLNDEEMLDDVQNQIGRKPQDAEALAPFTGDMVQDQQILAEELKSGSPDAYEKFIELHGEENVPPELEVQMDRGRDEQ
jgi:hypothetical protein